MNEQITRKEQNRYKFGFGLLIGIGIGVAIGVAFGAGWDNQAKKNEDD